MTTGADVLSLTKELVRQDSSHDGEGGQTAAIVHRLEQFYRALGVETTQIATPIIGNSHLIARIPGAGSGPPLMFLCHTDVVTADARSWTHPPFDAVEEGGFLWGRGSLDMKGMLAAVTIAVGRILAADIRLDRDLIMVYDCDEEGGQYGTNWLLKQHPELAEVGSVVTEGGWSILAKDGQTPMLAAMSCMERTFGALKVTTRSTATHSSRPLNDSAIASLSRIIARLDNLTFPIRLNSTTRIYFERLQDSTTDVQLVKAIGALLNAKTQEELDKGGNEVVAASDYPALHRSMLSSTMAFVVQRSGVRANVIPGEAWVMLQLRFAPGCQTPSEVIHAVTECVGSMGEVSVVGPPWESEADTLQRWQLDWSAPISDTSSDVFQSWESAVAAVYPNCITAPSIFEGGTSAKPWRELGVSVYGIYPYFVDNATLTAMHGVDERIKIEFLRSGEEVVYQLLRRFAVN